MPPKAPKRSAGNDLNDEQPKPKKQASAKKKTAAPVGMCSLNKKEFGDRIKDCLRLEKFAVQRMLISMDMDVTFFREFFGGERNGIVITPAEYNESSPVVVARLSKEAAGEIFGVTKIKNGNRYATFYLLKMVVILYPEEKKAQAWITV